MSFADLRSCVLRFTQKLHPPNFFAVHLCEAGKRREKTQLVPTRWHVEKIYGTCARDRWTANWKKRQLTFTSSNKNTNQCRQVHQAHERDCHNNQTLRISAQKGTQTASHGECLVSAWTWIWPTRRWLWVDGCGRMCVCAPGRLFVSVTEHCVWPQLQGWRKGNLYLKRTPKGYNIPSRTLHQSKKQLNHRCSLPKQTDQCDWHCLCFAATSYQLCHPAKCGTTHKILNIEMLLPSTANVLRLSSLDISQGYTETSSYFMHETLPDNSSIWQKRCNRLQTS